MKHLLFSCRAAPGEHMVHGAFLFIRIVMIMVLSSKQVLSISDLVNFVNLSIQFQLHVATGCRTFSLVKKRLRQKYLVILPGSLFQHHYDSYVL
jgi:hypothetical protein